MTVSANNRGGVRAVLDDVFVELWKAIVAVDGAVEEAERSNYEAYRRDLERRRALILGEFVEVFEESQQGATSAAGGGLDLKARPVGIRRGVRARGVERPPRR